MKKKENSLIKFINFLKILMIKMDYFNSFVSEIRTFRDKDLPKLISKLRKNIDDFRFLEKIIKVKEVNEDVSKEWELIAIDGGCDLTKLEGIAFAIATAQSFTLSSTSKLQNEEQRKLKLFPLDPKGDLRLTTSLKMKTQEIDIAISALESSRSNKILIFFDGSFSFPDTSIGNTNYQDLTESYREYVKTITNFFDLIVKKSSQKIIIPIAIAKDVRAAKYFTNLYENKKFQEINNLTLDEIKKIHLLLEHEGWKERAIIQAIMRENKEKCDKVQFLIPLIIKSNNKAMHGDYLCQYLSENKVFGSYFLYPKARKSFYFEFPSTFEKYFDEILSLLIFVCRVSPVLGYPFPLVYVDKLTRLSKDLSSKMFTQLIIEVKKAPNYVKELISEQLREDLH